MAQVAEVDRIEVIEEHETTFDLVIGDLEREIPDLQERVPSSYAVSCKSWYCC